MSHRKSIGTKNEGHTMTARQAEVTREACQQLHVFSLGSWRLLKDTRIKQTSRSRAQDRNRSTVWAILAKSIHGATRYLLGRLPAYTHMGRLFGCIHEYLPTRICTMVRFQLFQYISKIRQISLPRASFHGVDARREVLISCRSELLVAIFLLSLST